MKARITFLCFVVLVFTSGIVSADTFGTGDNQFDIDFVPISGDASSVNGTNISQFSNNDFRYRSFTDPGNFRIGTYEITNDQWSTFMAVYGTVAGSPLSAYDDNPTTTGAKPNNYICWYEAAQFVNWLNTSKGYQAAYKFIGTQGTSSYTLDIWDVTNAAGSNNLYRHKDAHYYLPTEDEWVKAAYWNGSHLQTYATIGDTVPVAGIDTNYDHAIGSSWNVGDGNKELNGTFDMMGNVWEWSESPYINGDYTIGSMRNIRGGSYGNYGNFNLESSTRMDYYPNHETLGVGFRVASVPEPTTLLLLGLGTLALRKRRR